MTVGAGKVWIVDAFTGTLFRVDGATGAVHQYRVGTDPWDMVVAFDAVWVTNRGDGTVTRVDPVTGVGEAIELGGLAPGGIAADEERGTIWVWAR